MARSQLRVLQFERGDHVSLGQRVDIGGADGGPAELVVLGDNVVLGDDVRILAPRVVIGDYTTIGSNTTICGGESLQIGECCRIGRNCVLGCDAQLTFGRGVSFGDNSTIHTSVWGGDPLAGSNFEGSHPALIEEDVCIGPLCSVGAVRIERQALVLPGSVVATELLCNRSYGGNPAVDMTYKVGAPFRERAPEDKFVDMCHRLRQFALAHPQYIDKDDPLADLLGGQSALLVNPRQLAYAVEGIFSLGGITIAMRSLDEDGTSTFDVRDRSYSKIRSEQEIAFMQSLLPHVRFYPRSKLA